MAVTTRRVHGAVGWVGLRPGATAASLQGQLGLLAVIDQLVLAEILRGSLHQAEEGKEGNRCDGSKLHLLGPCEGVLCPLFIPPNAAPKHTHLIIKQYLLTILSYYILIYLHSQLTPLR